MQFSAWFLQNEEAWPPECPSKSPKREQFASIVLMSIVSSCVGRTPCSLLSNISKGRGAMQLVEVHVRRTDALSWCWESENAVLCGGCVGDITGQYVGNVAFKLANLWGEEGQSSNAEDVPPVCRDGVPLRVMEISLETFVSHARLACCFTSDWCGLSKSGTNRFSFLVGDEYGASAEGEIGLTLCSEGNNGAGEKRVNELDDADLMRPFMSNRL